MKIKVRKIKRSTNPITESENDQSTLYSDYNHFIYGCRSYQYAIPQLRSFIAQEYGKLFPEKKYPKSVPIELVRLSVAYEILYRSFKKHNQPVPKKIERNRNALKEFNVLNMSPEMSTLTQLKLLYNKEGLYDMKTEAATVKKPTSLKPSPETVAKTNEKKKSEEKSSARLTVAQAYLQLFDSVAQGKTMTDLEMAKHMRRLFPTKKPYSDKDIRTVRAMYNRGHITGQRSQPRIPIQEYTGKKA